MAHTEDKIKKRKYSEDFLQCGFASVVTAGSEKLQYFIYYEVLSAESMMLSKLKHHCDSKHLSFAGKDINYLKCKVDEPKKARINSGG